MNAVLYQSASFWKDEISLGQNLCNVIVAAPAFQFLKLTYFYQQRNFRSKNLKLCFLGRKKRNFKKVDCSFLEHPVSWSAPFAFPSSLLVLLNFNVIQVLKKLFGGNKVLGKIGVEALVFTPFIFVL